MIPIAGSLLSMRRRLFRRRKDWKADYRNRYPPPDEDNQFGYLGIGLALLILLGSCAVPENIVLPQERVTSGYAEAPQGRPDLGTKWGEDEGQAVSALREAA